MSEHGSRDPLPGAALEDSAYRYFRAEIRADRFWARRDVCNILRKPRYYSRDREDDIVFDLGIEIREPQTKDRHLLVLIECKDTARTVSVDDVEEFHSKITQVSGNKGILVSSRGFQRGTLQFAKSKGIALLRLFSPDQVKWELRRTLLVESSACLFASHEEVLRGLVGEVDVSLCSRVQGCYGSIITNVPSILLGAMCEDAIADKALLSRLRVDRKPPSQVRFIEPERIQDIATSMLRRIQHSQGQVNLEAICSDRARAVGLAVRQHVKPSPAEVSAGVLGRVRFDPLEIVIFEGHPTDVAKRRFTLAHELGHVLLKHGRYIEAESCDSTDIELEDAAALGGSDLARLEWQANRLASELLMPQEAFVRDFWALAEKHDIRPRAFGPLFVDDQPCNRRSFFDVATPLSEHYGVSRSAVAVRLKTLGLLRLGELQRLGAGLRSILGRG